MRHYGRHLRLLPVVGDRQKHCGLFDVQLLKTSITIYAVGQEVYGYLGHDWIDWVAYGTDGGLAVVGHLTYAYPASDPRSFAGQKTLHLF